MAVYNCLSMLSNLHKHHECAEPAAEVTADESALRLPMLGLPCNELPE